MGFFLFGFFFCRALAFWENLIGLFIDSQFVRISSNILLHIYHVTLYMSRYNTSCIKQRIKISHTIFRSWFLYKT